MLSTVPPHCTQRLDVSKAFLKRLFKLVSNGSAKSAEFLWAIKSKNCHPHCRSFDSWKYGRKFQFQTWSLSFLFSVSGNDFVFVDNNAVIDGRYGQKMAVQRLFPGGPNFVQAAVYSTETRKAYLFKGKYRFDIVFPSYLLNSYCGKL